jgi:hypothetical protein
MNRSYRKWIPILGLLIACSLILGGCGESRTPFVGTYKSDQPVSGKGHIELVLRDNGEADWTWVDANRSSKFKWRVQDSRVWLYTKEGAILIATPADGAKHLSVDISGEWHEEGCPMERCINFTRLK